MHNLALIEESYKKFVKDLFYWIPEGIFLVNLDLLHHFDLLHFQPATKRKDPSLTRYFHIIESSEKITLVNDDYIVWIIPDRVDNIPVTYTLIALNKLDQELQLEAAFIASGVYNTSKLVLKVLEKFLAEIQDNEQMLAKYKNTA
ncbi:conserved hypothetical protein [Candidatus Protochlamydia naegleriophila]|uniref:Uncharacterized protein n=1 Tax=Candidatus Protochlamydia naegleriophila TaxID=389348 RepID=A0A0U5ETM1_9BACT|nr:hypothetical protein [Candidatus Protochlamydia naegleriophila]CUI17584.1 conserved hypothetical protein [Candidatus Protochlamydia naegleriophila]